MKKPKEDKPIVPRLAPEIKNLNGKSGKKLSKCIETLYELLDEDKEEKSPNEE